MKRFIATTALASVLATGAFAATQEQTTLINSLAPEVNVDAMTDQQVLEAVAIANGGTSDTHKRDSIQAIAMGDSAPTTFSPQQIAQIEEYLPASTVEAMSGEQLGTALSLINGADEDDDVQASLEALGRDVTPALTPSEIARVETLAPSADLTVLTGEQIDRLRAVIYSDESDGELKEGILEVVS